MSVLVDTNVFVAATNTKDEHHIRGLELVEELRRGQHGEAITTDFVFDEVVTVALARTGSVETAVKAAAFILPADPEGAWIRLQEVTRETLLRAWDLFRTSGRRDLSFTDWTLVAFVRQGRADSVVSFDEDLDGLVPRVS